VRDPCEEVGTREGEGGREGGWRELELCLAAIPVHWKMTHLFTHLLSSFSSSLPPSLFSLHTG
jgi:hypothetical protein